MRRQAYALWVGRLRLPLHESTRRAESAFDRERIASAFYIETEGRGMYVKQAKEMIHTACKTWAWSSILQTDSPASRGGVSLVSTTATPSSAERATTRDQHQAVNQANEETVSEAYASRPRPLDFIRTARPSPIDRPGFLRRALLVIGGYYSKESTVMRAAENLYNCVKEQATNQRMFTVMEVPRNKFQQQYSLLCLHVWLLIVRLRAEGPDGKRISQRLYEDFQADVEDRVRAFGVRVRVSKQLEELEKQFFGSAVAYDRCLRGESGESLSDALFRNIYLQDPEKKRAAKKLERYVRREMACLAITSSEAVTAGNIKFSSI